MSFDNAFVEEKLYFAADAADESQTALFYAMTPQTLLSQLLLSVDDIIKFHVSSVQPPEKNDVVVVGGAGYSDSEATQYAMCVVNNIVYNLYIGG